MFLSDYAPGEPADEPDDARPPVVFMVLLVATACATLISVLASPNYAGAIADMALGP